MKKVNILGIEIDLINSDRLIKEITNPPLKGYKIIGNANIKCMNLSVKSPSYKKFLSSCDTVFFDGVGVLLGAWLLGYNVKTTNRMTCPDYLDELIKNIIEKDLSIYFLASTQSVIDKLEAKLNNKHPNLRYKAHNGFFQKNGQENELVITDINNFQPDILYIGFGMPLQEKWIANNINSLNCKVLLPLGACLDFYVRELYRGPKFLTDYGFEWLFRLITEPKKLWKRYIVGNPVFIFRIILQKLNIKKY